MLTLTMHEDLGSALLAAGRFWQAVSSDDDEGLVRIVSASALERQPRTPDYPGFAAAFRNGWGLSSEAIDGMGWISGVGVLAGGGYRVRRTLQASGPYRAGVPIEAWPVDVIPDGEGGWLVDPIRPFPREQVGEVHFESGEDDDPRP